MTAGIGPAALFCLATGAALGIVFLLLKAVRLALRGGRVLTALFDLLFGLFCGAVVFLCALAVDKGRMRFFQAGLQMLGAWAAVTALDPFISGVGMGIRKVSAFIFRLLCLPWRRLGRKIAQRKAARARKKAGRARRKAGRGKRMKKTGKKKSG